MEPVREARANRLAVVFTGSPAISRRQRVAARIVEGRMNIQTSEACLPRIRVALLALPLALLAACAQMPNGPSVSVMPAPNKPLEVFNAEDLYCRDYSARSIGASTNAIAASNVAGAAAVGTVIGAAAGALIGGHNGAGAGAGVGLVAGSAVGLDNGAQAGMSAQRRYDIAYQQCMYSKGNILPTYVRSPYGYRYYHGGYTYAAPPQAAPPPPPPASPPPTAPLPPPTQ
jgi:hypothetical protein